MKTKVIRRKLRQIEDIVEDVEEWTGEHREELRTASYELGSLEEKLKDLRAFAGAAASTLDTIEIVTESDGEFTWR